MSLALRRRVPCEVCPLRQRTCFRPFTADELDYISRFKKGDLLLSSGTHVVNEGEKSDQLYTLLAGWAFRYKTLEDGRRQILNYLLPGDFIGLQSSTLGEMQHSVEALSSISLCVFQRQELHELFRTHPGLGFDITWLASREERMLDEHLLSVGRRSALERAAYLLAFLHQRGQVVGAAAGPVGVLPITQQHVADTLGLSVVHTNKTIRRLINLKLIRWLDRSCEVLDLAGLFEVAGWDGLGENIRPLI